MCPASPEGRVALKVDRSPKSPKLEAAAARERVPMAEAWASSADACPSAVPIGAAAAVPWLAIPSEPDVKEVRSEEHTSELQSLMRISYAVFCLKKKTKSNTSQILFH